jgi:hypothetical protein
MLQLNEQSWQMPLSIGTDTERQSNALDETIVGHKKELWDQRAIHARAEAQMETQRTNIQRLIRAEA